MAKETYCIYAVPRARKTMCARYVPSTPHSYPKKYTTLNDAWWPKIHTRLSLSPSPSFLVAAVIWPMHHCIALVAKRCSSQHAHTLLTLTTNPTVEEVTRPTEHTGLPHSVSSSHRHIVSLGRKPRKAIAHRYKSRSSPFSRPHHQQLGIGLDFAAAPSIFPLGGPRSSNGGNEASLPVPLHPPSIQHTLGGGR
jgi:hypothetical protein